MPNFPTSHFHCTPVGIMVFPAHVLGSYLRWHHFSPMDSVHPAVAWTGVLHMVQIRDPRIPLVWGQWQVVPLESSECMFPFLNALCCCFFNNTPYSTPSRSFLFFPPKHMDSQLRFQTQQLLCYKLPQSSQFPFSIAHSFLKCMKKPLLALFQFPCLWKKGKENSDFSDQS